MLTEESEEEGEEGAEESEEFQDELEGKLQTSATLKPSVPTAASLATAAATAAAATASGVSFGPYSLVAADLRDVAGLEAALSAEGFDRARPTLFLAECVLVYLKDLEAQALLAWAAAAAEHPAAGPAGPAEGSAQREGKPSTAAAEPGAPVRTASSAGPALFAAFEMVGPGDAFGQVMVRNIRARGCELHGMLAHPTLEAQTARFGSVGWAVGATTSSAPSTPPRFEAFHCAPVLAPGNVSKEILRFCFRATNHSFSPLCYLEGGARGRCGACTRALSWTLRRGQGWSASRSSTSSRSGLSSWTTTASASPLPVIQPLVACSPASQLILSPHARI